MPIWGVDIHPRYQAGISIEQIRREGFDFMACKVSEARNAASYEGSFSWLARGRRAGLMCLGYHYLRPGDEHGQARLFAAQLTRAGVPGMLDAEAIDSDGRATLGIGGIREFCAECRRLGARVPLLYLPRWYWDRLGRPDLRGLPPLWASRYVAGSDYASRLYEHHNPAGWEPYGGRGVEVLQFTDRGRVAGREIDCNAYRGSRADFARLIGTPLQEDTMATVGEIQGLLDRHAQRGDYLSPARRVDVGFARDQIRADLAAVQATQAEILTAVRGDDIDVEALLARIDAGVRAALAETHPAQEEIPTT